MLYSAEPTLTSTYVDRHGYLNNLGLGYFCRYQFLGAHTDIEAAVLYLNEAVSLLYDEHVDKPDHLTNLGNLLCWRFESFLAVGGLYLCTLSVVSLSPVDRS